MDSGQRGRINMVGQAGLRRGEPLEPRPGGWHFGPVGLAACGLHVSFFFYRPARPGVQSYDQIFRGRRRGGGPRRPERGRPYDEAPDGPFGAWGGGSRLAVAVPEGAGGPL